MANKKKENKRITYFDEWQFNNLIKLSEIDPENAIPLYEEYISKHPNDYCIHPWYSTTLATLGRYEEAKQVLEKINSIYIKDKNFTTSNKMNKLKTNLLYAEIKLLMYQEKYEQAYKLATQNYDFFVENGVEIERVIMLCSKHLGKLNINHRFPNSYLFRQIIEYQEVDLLYHVSKRHMDAYNPETNEKNVLVFNHNFPLEKIVKELKKYIPSSNCMHYGLIEDTYIFKYDGCGKHDNKNVDYFRVIALINSDTLITIYPYEENKHLPYIDLNYLKEEIPKQKRKSQIDKFNEKYKNY